MWLKIRRLQRFWKIILCLANATNNQIETLFMCFEWKISYPSLGLSSKTCLKHLKPLFCPFTSCWSLGPFYASLSRITKQAVGLKVYTLKSLWEKIQPKSSKDDEITKSDWAHEGPCMCSLKVGSKVSPPKNGLHKSNSSMHLNMWSHYSSIVNSIHQVGGAIDTIYHNVNQIQILLKVPNSHNPKEKGFSV